MSFVGQWANKPNLWTACTGRTHRRVDVRAAHIKLHAVIHVSVPFKGRNVSLGVVIR